MDILVKLVDGLGWGGIAAGTLAYFVLGAPWFAPFGFGKLWDRALGFERPAGMKFPPLYYVGPLLGCFVATVAMAVLLNAMGIEAKDEAAIFGLITGVGVAGSVSFVNAITPKVPKPFLYGAVTGGYHAVGLVLASVILTALR